jgi:hypothetical protein
MYNMPSLAAFARPLPNHHHLASLWRLWQPPGRPPSAHAAAHTDHVIVRYAADPIVSRLVAARTDPLAVRQGANRADPVAVWQAITHADLAAVWQAAGRIDPRGGSRPLATRAMARGVAAMLRLDDA